MLFSSPVHTTPSTRRGLVYSDGDQLSAPRLPSRTSSWTAKKKEPSTDVGSCSKRTNEFALPAPFADLLVENRLFDLAFQPFPGTPRLGLESCRSCASKFSELWFSPTRRPQSAEPQVPPVCRPSPGRARRLRNPRSRWRRF